MGLVKKTSWSFLGLGFRLLFQSLSFVFLARTLGAGEFGEFAATLALVLFFVPFIEMGGYSLIVKQIASGERASVALSGAIGTTLFMVPAGLSILILCKIYFLDKLGWMFVFCITGAEFMGARLLSFFTAANVAQNQIWKNSIMELIAGMLRLSFVFLLGYLKGDISIWGGFYFLHSSIVGAIALLWTTQASDFPFPQFKNLKSRIKEGVHFALGLSAQSAYTDIDKVILSKLSTFQVTGVYSSAYKIITFAFLPMSAFLTIIYPDFFRAGKSGPKELLRLTCMVIKKTVCFGALASLGLFFLAPLVPVFLGPDFKDSVPVLRFLCILPLLQGLYYPAGDALTGSGHQSFRSKAQLPVLGINILMNILLIPSMGWQGAAIATLISETILIFLYGSKLWIICQSIKLKS